MTPRLSNYSRILLPYRRKRTTPQWISLHVFRAPSRYKEAVGVYEYKHREWERLEVERKERLSMKCHQSRLDHLNLDSLTGLTK